MFLNSLVATMTSEAVTVPTTGTEVIKLKYLMEAYRSTHQGPIMAD